MQSPKSKKRPWQSQKAWKPVWKKKVHHNKKFYNSKAWKDTRKGYINALQHKLWQEALQNKWSLTSADLELTDYQKAYLMSLDFVPCERCIRMYAIGAYSAVVPGVDLDHIDPINPDNALDSQGWGNPFDHDNLQLLCKKHHSKKTGRDKKIIQAKT